MSSKVAYLLSCAIAVSLVGSVLCRECHWNRKCSYDLFGAITPYESIRGDVRDLPKDSSCETLSIWSLHRHGSRNPSSDATLSIKNLQGKILQNVLLETWSANYCAQDVEDLMSWKWNSTLENATAFLTGGGYEEVYLLGRRIRIGYNDFLRSVNEVYFRATNEQRTATSAVAFVEGLSIPNGPNFSMWIDQSTGRDDIIRPYENCERYQEEVKNGALLADEVAAYDSSPEYLDLRDRVQVRLFSQDYQLTYPDVFTLYNLCRFDSSWNVRLRSPWCGFFTDEDLVVLEYRDDVRHYYRNGYGSSINAQLGAIALKDLYEKFVISVQDDIKSFVSYFTHDTMMEMVYCALGLFKDPGPLRGSSRNASRRWRTSQFSAFASNFIAVLSRCEESGNQTHRVQLLINEKTTPLCPEEGCTWQEFLDIFQEFSETNLDFCTERSESGTAGFMSGQSDIKMSMATSLMVLVGFASVLRYQ